ncbi:DciA family protein [Methyloglobulus sp.]|uniref:DciA family protein n=1 Tax=Methyloglobulus sp. TaxID=2518622 RepID=UPI0032B81F04
MAQNAKPLKAVLSYPNKTIALLCLQINQQLAILKHVKAVLPKELANHALHCVFNDKKLNNRKLLIYTDSAVWASQLRFYGKTLLTAIESVTSESVSVLQIKVINVPETANTRKKCMTAIPSQAVVDEINSFSHTVTDTKLKHSLEQLSSTLSRLHNRNS